jgi:hypothetical protein
VVTDDGIVVDYEDAGHGIPGTLALGPL